MAGWLHGVFVGEWLFVFPLCGFSLSLFCNYHGGYLCPGMGTIQSLLEGPSDAVFIQVLAGRIQ